MIFVMLVLMDLIFAKSIFIGSIGVIEAMQEPLVRDTSGISVRSKEVFFKVIDYLTSVGATIVIVCIIFNFVSRQRAFYYATCVSLALFLRYNLRLTYRSPKPFMTSYNIYPFTCDLTYGNPNSP